MLCVQDNNPASSEGAVQVINTRRRVVSVEDATAKLDALARRCHITNPRYEESEADSLSEFDALKWISLCSQRAALLQRESERTSREWPVPSIFQGIYATKHCSTSKKLENTYDGQLSLAA
jgi:hypothetical protein